MTLYIAYIVLTYTALEKKEGDGIKLHTNMSTTTLRCGNITANTVVMIDVKKFSGRVLCPCPLFNSTFNALIHTWAYKKVM